MNPAEKVSFPKYISYIEKNVKLAKCGKPYANYAIIISSSFGGLNVLRHTINITKNGHMAVLSVTKIKNTLCQKAFDHKYFHIHHLILFDAHVYHV